jgi:putative two-component system response regulator
MINTVRQKILVVDDEPANLNLMRQILKNNYDLAFAKSGEDAISNMDKQIPDLILLDVMMPGMDGYEVCERIKADPRLSHVPVIFCTAMSEEGDEIRGFKVGASDYVTKPVRPAVVLARVETHLTLADQQRATREEVKIANQELLDSRLKTLLMLGKAAEFKDNDTGLHVVRMSLYCKILAVASGWNDESCDVLINAAPMHDIGKISTPDDILKKPGPLTPSELVIMRQHSEAGAQIIKEAKSDTPMFKMALDIALHHHEKWDGSGYPLGLSGNDIPLSARVVAIADVFDALTSQRPYKSAWPLDKAFEYLKENAGTHFDPGLVGIFLDLKEEISDIQLLWSEPLAAPENN